MAILSDPTPSTSDSLWLTAQKLLTYVYRVITGTASFKVTSSGVPGLQIPDHNQVALSYVGSTNNVNTVIYKMNGTPVATLTFTYAGGVPSSNDALILSVTKS